MNPIKDNNALANAVVQAFTQKNKTLTIAESCTGGLIASMITAIAGSSKMFEAGFITYSNNIKHRILNVDVEVLQEHGAVSEAVVRQMALGALEKSAADYAIAVSGIAGPDGGTAEKPVGTVWIAWGEKNNIKAQKIFHPAERNDFQAYVSAYALDLIRKETFDIHAN